MEQSLFKYNAQNSITLLFMVIISIVVMTIDHRNHYLESVRSNISHLLFPIRYIVNLPSDIVYWGQENLSTRERLLNENKALRKNNFTLKANLQKYSTLKRENQRLRALFHSSKKIKAKVLIAEILSVDLDPYKKQIMINQGSNQNTYIGQPIIDADGIIGQLIHTDPYASTALLISDPSHAIPVRIDRTGLRTIALGTGNPQQLKLAYIPENSDIKIGDLVVTSGLGQRFPANYPVAKVTEITHIQGEPFSKIYATPAAKLNQTHEVLLIWHNQPNTQPKKDKPDE